MPSSVAYPPLDTLKPVADDLWIVDSAPIHVAGLPFPLRMTVFRLPGGGLLLHSPTRWSMSLAAALAEVGPVAHILMPSFAHWLFAKAWQSRLPHATLWAAPGMRERAVIRASGLRIDHVLDEAAPEAWAGVIEHILVSGGLGFCEVGLFHRPSRTLVMTDLVQNLDLARLPWASRALVRAMGGSGPAARPPWFLRAIVRLGGRRAREAGRRLLACEPDRLLFAHGAWFEDDGAARLRRSLRWLVR